MAYADPYTVLLCGTGHVGHESAEVVKGVMEGKVGHEGDFYLFSVCLKSQQHVKCIPGTDLLRQFTCCHTG